MKKRFFRLFPVLFALLMIVSACTPKAPGTNGPDENPPLPGPAEGGDWTTNRGLLAEENLSFDARDFTKTSEWAELWIKTRYPDSGVSVVETRHTEGAYAPDALWDGLSVYVANWQVDFTVETPPEGLSADESRVLSEEVQIVAVEDGQKTYASDFLTGGQRLSRVRPLYDYIGGDSRFASRRRPWPASGLSSGVREVNLSEALGIPEFRAIAVINETIVAAVEQTGRAEDGKVQNTIYFYDFIAGKVSATRDFEGYVLDARGEDGNLRLSTLPNEFDGEAPVEAALIAPDGQIQGEWTEPGYGEEQVTELPEKDGVARRIISKKNSLYLKEGDTETLLLKGVWNEKDEIKNELFRLVEVIDENRFSYVLYGYEWIIRCGVYDLAAKADHVMEVDGSVGGWYPVQAAGGKLYAVYSEAGFAPYPAVMDLTDYQSRILLPSGEYAQGETDRVLAFSPSGRYFAQLSYTETDASLSALDTERGTIVSSRVVKNPFVSFGFFGGLRFLSDSRLAVIGAGRAMCDSYLYIIDIDL